MKLDKLGATIDTQIGLGKGYSGKNRNKPTETKTEF